MKNCYVDYKHRAIVDLVDGIIMGFENGLLITRINVPKQHRNKGVARKLLQQILNDADKDAVTLYLEIQPSDGLNFKQLKDWYERHNFKEFKLGVWKRNPIKKG